MKQKQKVIRDWRPDWRDKTQYPDPERTINSQWAWEFLRRNEDYQDFWNNFFAPYYDDNDKLFNLEEISKNARKVWNEDEFIKETLLKNREFSKIYPLKLYENKFGIMLQSAIPPYDNFGYPVFLKQFPCFQQKPISYFTEQYKSDNFDLNDGDIVIKFNALIPLSAQLDKAACLINNYKMHIENSGYSVPNDKKRRTTLYNKYLRILDARFLGITFSEIASVIYPHLNNESPEYEASHTVQKNFKAAEILKNYDYRFISYTGYPLITLIEARDARDNAKKLLANNIDPSLDKKKRKQSANLQSENTFERLAREWHENNADKWSENYRNNLLHRLQTDIFPEIGAYPITDITPPDLLSALRKIEKRGAHEIAHRAKQTCGQIFRYAIATGRAERDPSNDLQGALKPVVKGHYSALDAKDLPAFLGALERNEARLFPQTLNAVKLLMLTFVRTSELINATWDEIDFDEAMWTIPGARMKMGKDHLVPLSAQTVALLRKQQQTSGEWSWVFPSVVSPGKSMSDNTMLGAIRRLGFKDKTTGYGFRALAISTIKEKLGYRHEVIDRQLAHAPISKVDRAYDRAQFIDERKKMMQEWADYLDKVA